MEHLRYHNCIILLNTLFEQLVREFIDGKGDEQMNKKDIRYMSSLLEKNPDKVIKAVTKLKAAITLYELKGKRKESLISGFMGRI